jgi:hypothetical protein
MDDVGEGDLVEPGAALVANLDRLPLPAAAEAELGPDQLASAPNRLIPGRLGVGQGKPFLVLETAAVAGDMEIITGHGGVNGPTR